MSKKSKIIYFFSTLIFFVLMDLYLTDIILKDIYRLPKNPVLDFIFIQNTGAAFSMFEGFKIFLITFSAIAFCVIIYYVFRQLNNIKTLTLFFAGALSAGIFVNMFERILFGYVRDYIKLNFVNFPIFNISDLLINVGVFALIIIIAKNSYLKK